ncbi:MAG: hypothetical protein Q8S14_17195, partial [Algoriphagus sp.]|uniref:hypothetical protein n=1 Tax=Algoriphagus sp. TaxID=1872435 RepID=UPI00273632F1
VKINTTRINKANKFINNACFSAFLSNKALIGDTILKTNLKIRESKNRIMIVGKTNNSPSRRVLIKNGLDQNLSNGIFLFGFGCVEFSIDLFLFVSLRTEDLSQFYEKSMPSPPIPVNISIGLPEKEKLPPR